MKPPRIHIISIKPEICSLIKKALAGYEYIISCNSGETINENSITRFEENVDCLIIDKNIEPKISKKAKEIFKDAFIIYLPSLGSDINGNSGIKNMSEPFKLSELKKEIEFIFQKNVR